MACRRREIEINCTGDEAKDYVLLQAAQQDLTRSNLADWDSSARAWLRTADEAKQLQQTQLMLIINNLHIPVSNNMSVYQSIIESSKNALVSMESVLKGMPQRVQSGAFLLGLSAWHLYPDMVVHGSVTRKVQQRDQLVPTGTMITLGLESVTEAVMGVYWSLPLAHLRFYGDPVQSIRSTGHDASRIPAEQLVYVVLGVILRQWVETSSMIHLGLRWLTKIYFCVKRATQVEGGDEAAVREAERTRKLFEDCRWLNILLGSVESFNKLHEHEMEIPIKLMATGFRRFEGTLDKEHPLPQVFGLLNVRNLFPLLRTDMVEERIRILRRVAAQLKASPAEMIIRYKRYSSPQFTRIREDTGAEELYLSSRQEEFYEYASALPYSRGSTKRNYSGECSRVEKHKRWIAIPRAANLSNEPDPYNDYLPTFPPYKTCTCAPMHRCKCYDVPGGWSRDDMHLANTFDNYDDDQELSLDSLIGAGHYDSAREEGFSGGGASTGKAPVAKFGKAAVENLSEPLEEAIYGIRATEILATGEDCVQEDADSFADHFEQYYSTQGRRPVPMAMNEQDARKEYDRHYKLAWKNDCDHQAIYLRDGPWGNGGRSLNFLYGDEDSAALYRVSSIDALYRVSSIVPLDYVKMEVEIGELEALLDQDALKVAQLIQYIGHYPQAPYENLGSSLKAFASFMKVYQSLPEATIALKIAYKPLHQASWARHAAAREVAAVPRGKDSAEMTKKERAPQKGAWSWSLSLAETFACIAMFESGTYDLDPSALEHVFAISSSNSLFVAAPLLNDPSQCHNDCAVLRVVGNIGRAGIAMLIAPQDPRTRKLESDTWELISHAPFDGKIENSFRNTSLHLSFTQYTLPVNTGDSGGQDIEAFYLESLISVYDRDKWVADLDILKMLGSELFQRHTYTKACDHRHGQTPRFDLISIDNWEELLDREEVPTVVRAYRNKMARLATAAISVRQGRPTIILPDDFCFACDVSEPRHEATTYIA